MFDIGFTEILMIGVVALVVIGPERLPEVARRVGKWVAKMQRFVRGVKTDLASELESGELKKLLGDQREQINELRKIVQSTQNDLQSTGRDVVQSAKKSLDSLEQSVEEVDLPASTVSAKPSSVPVLEPPPQSPTPTPTPIKSENSVSDTGT